MQTLTPPTGDATAIVQAALKASASVLLAAGVWNFTAPLVRSGGTVLLGEGPGTILRWPVDLGPGIVCLQDGNGCVLEKLTIQGPGTATLTPGCDGWAHGSGSVGRDLYVQGFRAGIVSRLDHGYFYSVSSKGSYYNVFFADNPVATSNHHFYACQFDSPKFASVAVAPDNLMDQVLFSGGHVGQGPYGFYKFGVNTRGFMDAVKLDGLAFEGLGNGAIMDASTGADSQINGLDWRNQNFTWNPLARIPTLPADWAFSARTVLSARIFCGSYPLTPGAIGAYYTSGLSYLDIDLGTIGQFPANLFGGKDGKTWNVQCGGSTVRDGVNWAGAPKGNAGVYAIAQGQITEYGSNYNAVRAYGELSKLKYGIAAEPIPVGGWGVVVRRGVFPAAIAPTAIPAAAQLGYGVPLYPSTTGPWLSPASNGDPLAISDSIGAGTVPVNLI